MAVALTSKGHSVIGVDISDEIVEKIGKKQSPINEPGVQELLSNAIEKNLFRATHDFREAVSQSDISFIAVNTPKLENHNMDLSQVVNASEMVARALKEKPSFHVVAISSTVLPETAERIIKPILEEHSGKTAGKEFGLCVNPVFIALTTVVRDFLAPPVLVIGESDPRSGDLLLQLYNSVLAPQPETVRTTLFMAELIKMAHNAYATMKVAFINEIADLCSRIPDADITAFEAFLKAGGERSGRFLKSGLGFGGPCFPRDLNFFTDYMKKYLTESSLLESIEMANEKHADHVVAILENELQTLVGTRIAILGLSYKPNSSITEASFSLKLIERLLSKGVNLSVYDPQVHHLEDFEIEISKTVEDALRNSDACILATPWDEFKTLGVPFFKKTMRRSVVLDPWGALDLKDNEKFDRYLRLGKGSAPLQAFLRK